jgi:hypothetical protein
MAGMFEDMFRQFPFAGGGLAGGAPSQPNGTSQFNGLNDVRKEEARDRESTKSPASP